MQPNLNASYPARRWLRNFWQPVLSLNIRSPARHRHTAQIPLPFLTRQLAALSPASTPVTLLPSTHSPFSQRPFLFSKRLEGFFLTGGRTRVSLITLEPSPPTRVTGYSAEGPETEDEMKTRLPVPAKVAITNTPSRHALDRQSVP